MRAGVCIFFMGGLGVLCRYWMTGLWSATLALWIINVLGSFGMGVVAATCSGFWRDVLGTGFLGGFTTFSALSLVLVQLAQRQLGMAILYGLASIITGALAAGAGLGVVQLYNWFR